MSKKILIFMLLFSLGLIAASLYIMSTLDIEPKPKPTAKIINIITGIQGALNDQFQLQSTDGKAFTLDDLKNKYTILYFGFAHCPDICPVTVQKMSEASTLLSEKELSESQFIFISVDPKRDTLEDLNKFVGQFGNNVKGVTGSKEEIDKLSSSLQVYYAQMKDESANQDNYYVDHSSFIYLLNPDATLISQFTPKASAEEIAQQIKNEISKTAK